MMMPEERVCNEKVVSTGASGSKRKRKAKEKKSKSKSIAWTQFEKLSKGDDGIEHCKCKFCLKTFTCNSVSGTNHLLRHMKRCLSRDNQDVSQMLLSSTQGSLSLHNGSFSEDRFRALLVHLITLKNLSFECVEWKLLRELCEYLRPGTPTISRNTAKADVLKLYELEKKNIKGMMVETPGRVSLTADLWTVNNNDGYLALTAHFVDVNWSMKKYVLNLSYMPASHTSLAIAEKILALLIDWGVAEKLSTLTFDNASSNDTCINFLKANLRPRKALLVDGDLFHVWCCAHILNLIVQEGLKNVDGVVEKVRAIVRHVRNSQGRKEKFLESVRTVCLDNKRGLRQDVPTRWNSTFFMLQSALHYRDALDHLGMIDPTYTCGLNSSEWDKAARICNFLEAFYDLTCLFTGTKYPTSNLFFPHVVVIYDTLRTERRSEDDFMREMVAPMVEKFEKYWSNFNETLTIAVILDPRYKFGFVEWAYKRIYGGSWEAHSKKVRARLDEIFSEYSQGTNSSSVSTSPSRTQRRSNLEASQSGLTTLQQKTKLFLMAFSSSNDVDIEEEKSKMDKYLEEKKASIHDEFDILDFWWNHAPLYPIVSRMARDFLCIPITTVASESAFSSSGRIIDRFRSTIRSENDEALLCLRDWIPAYREQDIEAAEEKYKRETIDVFESDRNEENIPTQGSSTS